MAEKPILYTGPMVRGILMDCKKQTRRVITHNPDEDGLSFNTEIGEWQDSRGRIYHCPYGKPGDFLWVRESFVPVPDLDHDAWDDHHISAFEWNRCGCKVKDIPEELQVLESVIHAEGYDRSTLNWRPSIHMPRWASRILLKITDIRVERLQDITERDARAEGVERVGGHNSITPWKNYQGTEYPCENFASAVVSFASLWDSINGNRKIGCEDVSWKANPWVWVIDFERVKS